MRGGVNPWLYIYDVIKNKKLVTDKNSNGI
jgi:hypothetical protein